MIRQTTAALLRRSCRAYLPRSPAVRLRHASSSAPPAPLDSVPGPAEYVGTPAVSTSKGKVWPSADEAVSDIKSGSVVLSAGFGLCGTAETLIEAIGRNPAIKDLTGMSNNAGDGVYGLGKSDVVADLSVY